MRKMLNTLFITSEDAYLALENENVVIFRGEEKMGQYPLQILENVVSFSYKGASPALMDACAQRNIHLCFLTPNGRFLARVCGQSRGNVLLRKTQYRVSDDPAKSCTVARNMIFGKLSLGAGTDASRSCDASRCAEPFDSFGTAARPAGRHSAD